MEALLDQSLLARLTAEPSSEGFQTGEHVFSKVRFDMRWGHCLKTLGI